MPVGIDQARQHFETSLSAAPLVDIRYEFRISATAGHTKITQDGCDAVWPARVGQGIRKEGVIGLVIWLLRPAQVQAKANHPLFEFAQDLEIRIADRHAADNAAVTEQNADAPRVERQLTEAGKFDGSSAKLAQMFPRLRPLQPVPDCDVVDFFPGCCASVGLPLIGRLKGKHMAFIDNKGFAFLGVIR